MRQLLLHTFLAICKKCRYSKSKTPFVSCNPSRRLMCENQELGLQQDDRLNNINIHNVIKVSSSSDIARLSKRFAKRLLLALSVLDDFMRGPILERFPKDSRKWAVSALCSIIINVCRTHPTIWGSFSSLLPFAWRSRRGRKRQPSLITTINRQIDAFLADSFCHIDNNHSHTNSILKRHKRNIDIPTKLDGKKLASNDIQEAIRMVIR